MGEPAGKLPIRVEALLCVDAVLRRGKRLLVHLINRASSIPNRPNDGSVDQILGGAGPGGGRNDKHQEGAAGLEKGKVKWSWKLALRVPQCISTRPW